MIDERDTREDWSVRFVAQMADELHRGVQHGALTTAEAHQLGSRLRVLLEQALDVPSLGPRTLNAGSWDWATSGLAERPAPRRSDPRGSATRPSDRPRRSNPLRHPTRRPAAS
ncbi:MAG TPA: hypothetical protein VGH99_08810 [Pseudonocardia sp.]|jgi:hypothetical protein